MRAGATNVPAFLFLSAKIIFYLIPFFDTL